MRHILILFLFTSPCLSIQGQNLVRNPSFEMIDSCSYPPGMLASGWTSATNFGSPDLFHLCSVDPQFQPPEVLGCQMQMPHSGEGMAGLIVYGNYPREYLQTELIEPLIAGEKYLVSFYVAATGTCAPGTFRYTDIISLAFSERELSVITPTRGDNPIVLSPVIGNSGTPINNVGEWKKYSTCYIADGTESHLVLGSFKPDNATILTASNPSSVIENYLFVDDVSVKKFDPLPDTTLLCGDEKSIEGSFEGLPLMWSTGERDFEIVVRDSGMIEAQVTVDGCVFKDTTYVFDIRNFTQFSFDEEICEGNSILLKPEMPGDYVWLNGSREKFRNITMPGVFSATVKNECDTYSFEYNVTVRNCECDVFVPSGFSPNNDGINDEFGYFFGCSLPYSFKQFSIFDRWGNMIYKTNKENEFWDGKHAKKPIQQGVYIWVLEYETESQDGVERIVAKGDVMLLK